MSGNKVWSKLSPLHVLDESKIVSEILEQDEAIVFFSSVTHPSCKSMNKLMENLQLGTDEPKIYEIDAIENPLTVETFGIRSIPSIITFKKGQMQKCSIGNLSKRQSRNRVKQLHGLPCRLAHESSLT